MSPVARMLDQRNLLQSHSRLGRSPSALLGRLDYLLKEDGHWRGEVSLAESSGPVNPLLRTDTTTNPRSHSSRLTERLEEKADRYYRLGVASFREGRYPRSQEYFKLVRQLENDHPRAFVANVLVSLHGSDLNTAVINLIHAIHRADSLADLRLEWKDFYAEEQAFQRVTDSVNVMAKSGAGTNKTMNLILAYYSFLNGDLITAIAAAKVVEEQATSGAPGKVSANSRPGSRRKDLFSGAAKRFGEFLAAARDQGGAPQGDE